MKNGKSTEEALEWFMGICKSHGLKITPQRIAVYEVVLHAENHPSAESIYRDIRDKHPGISFDTVNRTLLTFAALGLVETVEGSGEARRFDVNTDRHHHVRCLGCGSIRDIYEKGYNDLEIPAGIREGFTVKRIRVVIEGICNDCRSASGDAGVNDP